MNRNNRVRHQFFFVLTMLFVFVACQREIEEFWTPSYDYYPLVTGKYKVYQIDSIVYDEYNCEVDTVSYQIKEVTGDTARDGEDDLYYRVERFYRKDSASTWTMVGVWTEKIEDYQVQRVENNQRLIPLVFPVKENQRWDGIVYIRRDTLVPIRGGSIDMFKDWDEFVLEEVDAPYINPLTNVIYNETALILQVDKENNIERRYSLERYAKNIGLVYKEMRILDSQCRTNGQGEITCEGVGNIADCLFLPWTAKAEKGFILKQTLIDHNY